MLNQFVIVGKLTGEPKVKKLKDGKKVSNITLAVPRNYKNANGEYDTDFIDCTLWENIAKNIAEHCHKGDLIGIKGRIESIIKTDDEGFANGKEMVIIAEKVTFLSSKKNEE